MLHLPFPSLIFLLPLWKGKQVEQCQQRRQKDADNCVFRRNDDILKRPLPINSWQNSHGAKCSKDHNNNNSNGRIVPDRMKNRVSNCQAKPGRATRANPFFSHPNLTYGQQGAVILTFFTFWGITTHPWHPKGPRIRKLAKNFFQLHAWPAEIFGKNRKMRFFGMISKFNFRSPVWQIFTIFSACFIYGILNTHNKF